MHFYNVLINVLKTCFYVFYLQINGTSTFDFLKIKVEALATSATENVLTNVDFFMHFVFKEPYD